jgi:hypothetical protein
MPRLRSNVSFANQRNLWKCVVGKRNEKSGLYKWETIFVLARYKCEIADALLTKYDKVKSVTRSVDITYDLT